MNDKTVLVFGSNKGIGFATLRNFLILELKYLHKEKLIETLDSIGKLNDKNIIPINLI